MRDVTVTHNKWTCDVCGDVETTPRGIPDGWRRVVIQTYEAMRTDSAPEYDVCGKNNGGCFRSLLIRLSNADHKEASKAAGRVLP